MSLFSQGPEGDEAVEMAIASPEKFVLKPQREGGGKFYTFKNYLKKINVCKCILIKPLDIPINLFLS